MMIFYYNNQSSSKKEISIKKVSLDDIMKNPEHKRFKQPFVDFKEKISFNNSNAQGKLIFNEELGIYIDDENGMFIEKGDYQSYTFRIERSESDEKLENIVFSSKLNGDFIINIVKYDITYQEIATLGKEEISKRDVEYSYFNNYQTEMLPDLICDLTWNYEFVPNNQGDVIPNTPLFVEELVLDINCYWETPGVGGGSGGGSGTGGIVGGIVGGGGGSWGGSGSYPGSNNPGWTYPGNPGWTNPNNPGNNPGNSGNDNNDNPAELTDANTLITTPVISSVKSFVYSLDSNQLAWWNDPENDVEKDAITQYLEQNAVNPQAQAFALWAINFFDNNSDITWVQFENWYKGTVDLDNNSIGGYDNTTYQMVNPNNLQQDWPTIESVIPVSDFVGFRDELTPDGTRYLSCMDFAKEQIATKGYTISNYDAPGQTFQIYKESTGVNVEALWEGISYLKYALSNGIPVIVGVDNKSGSPNPYTDNTTDHFIVIVGTGVNFQGEIYFRFFDNATNYSSQGASPYNMLFLDNILNMLVGQTEVATYRNNFTEYNYIVTQIRKSK